MSVYIKGFPLPNNCGACPLRLAWCRERIYMVARPERCPLVPVPEHGRLGDLDALHKLFLDKGKEYKGVGGAMLGAAAWCIANAPTIIPAEDGE